MERGVQSRQETAKRMEGHKVMKKVGFQEKEGDHPSQKKGGTRNENGQPEGKERESDTNRAKKKNSA